MKTPTTKMSTNCQVVIPIKIREKANLKPGMKFHVLHQDGNIILKPVHEDVSTRRADLPEIINDGNSMTETSI